MAVEAPTAAAIKAKFPEFATLDDSAIEAAAATALELSTVSPTATVYLTAHLLTLQADAEEREGKVDGGLGEVKSEREGQKQVTYVTQSAEAGDSFYATTHYGRTFLALERRAPSKRIAVAVY